VTIYYQIFDPPPTPGNLGPLLGGVVGGGAKNLVSSVGAPGTGWKVPAIEFHSQRDHLLLGN